MSVTSLSIPSHHISYAQYADRLVKASNIRRYKLKLIGTDTFDKIGMEYPVYKVTINRGARRKFCIVAGVHGYEVAGPLALLHFLEEGKIFRDNDIEYTIFPMINPSSFDLKQRSNDKGSDINAIYKTTLESENYQEIQLFHDEIVNKKFDVFLSLHEDIDEEKFYAYVFEHEEQSVYRKILKNVKKVMRIKNNADIQGENEKVIRGLVINDHDRSLEDYMFSQGKAKLALATETGMKNPLQDRIKANQVIIETLAGYLVEVDESKRKEKQVRLKKLIQRKLVGK